MSNRTLKLKTQKALTFAENHNKTKQKPKQNKTVPCFSYLHFLQQVVSSV